MKQTVVALISRMSVQDRKTEYLIYREPTPDGSDGLWAFVSGEPQSSDETLYHAMSRSMLEQLENVCFQVSRFSDGKLATIPVNSDETMTLFDATASGDVVSHISDRKIRWASTSEFPALSFEARFEKVVSLVLERSRRIEMLASYATRLSDADFEVSGFGEILCADKWVSEDTTFHLTLFAAMDSIRIEYGFALPSKSEEKSASSDYCHLRFLAEIADEADERTAEQMITAKYHEHFGASREAILALVKVRRKAFMQIISDRLKPLCFKKKGNHWYRSLNDGGVLEFEAQKSAFCDEYYFNIRVIKETDGEMYEHFWTRMRLNEEDRFDWALLSRDTFATLLDETVENMIVPMIRSTKPLI